MDDELPILTGGERYLIAKAIFADGSIRHVTSETRFQVSNESILRIDENGIMHALRDGTAMVTASYTSPGGDTGEAVFNVRATTFPSQQICSTLPSLRRDRSTRKPKH